MDVYQSLSLLDFMRNSYDHKFMTAFLTVS